MAIIFQHGSPTTLINQEAKQIYIREILQKIKEMQQKSPRKVLLLPPDITRYQSDAGMLTQLIYAELSATAQIDIMPTLGTHVPMTEQEIRSMFGANIPLDRFKIHNWKQDVKILGEISGDTIRDWSEGRVDYSMQVGFNKLLLDGGYDLVLSIGQIVPHEVVGMANFTKNVCVGIGGADLINKSHFLGAAYGMERIMGRIDTPVRRVFDTAFSQYLGDMPIFFLMTVIGGQAGETVMRGLYCGDKDGEAFRLAAELSQQVNLDLLDAPLDKVVVYLNPKKFRSTWLGNKAIYRTRMVMADRGELIVLAPGLKEFGEDPDNDRLIRKYGYRGTPTTLQAVKEDADLRNHLGAAAHFIHGSSEGRFSITYCPGAGMTQAEIESVGYRYASYDDMTRRYSPNALKDGWNTLPDGEQIFYVSDPALGLWALRGNFSK